MSEKRALYQIIASKVEARLICYELENMEWLERHRDDVDRLVSEHMPSGAGFDSGTTLDWDRSTGEKLVFHTSFHHMNEAGMYDGWTEHDLIVRPSLSHKFTFTISGRNRNDIKEYIADVFNASLAREIEL